MGVNFYAKFRIFVGTLFLYALIQAVNNIDTRVGQAQQLNLYVFDSQQTLTNNTAFYGGVEFAQGITLTSTTVNPYTVTLGVNQPLSGSLRLAGITNATINMPHDLTLNVTQYPGGIRFNITPNPSTLFLTRDISVPIHTSFLVQSDSGGILNGNNNSIILESTQSNFAIGTGLLSSFSNPYMTVKNLAITGVGSLNNIQFNSPVKIQNVQILATSSNAFIAIAGRIIFEGQNNILGNGNLVELSVVSNAPNSFTIASQSRVHINPNTLLELASDVPTAFRFYFTDQSSQLLLDNCTLQFGTGQSFNTLNATFTAGTIIINGTVTLTSILPGSSLQLGDGISRSNNCNLILLAGAKLIVDNNVTFSFANV